MNSRPLGLELRQPLSYFLTHREAVHLREREVSLWHRPDPCFDWIPIIIKTLHHVFAFFSLYTDLSKARVGQQALQPVRVSQ
jgi:hypothetical protein